MYSQAERIKLAVSVFDSLTEKSDIEEAGIKSSQIIENGYAKIDHLNVRNTGAINDYINRLMLA